jgi:hypothetical protein
LPWSTWPIVPMLQCGLLRSNFAFAMTSCLFRLYSACAALVSVSFGVAENLGAGEGNRTLIISLEGCCSTIELHPLGVGSVHSLVLAKHWWRGLDSNQRRRSQRIYSPSPLATRAPLRINFQLGQRVRKPVTGRRVCFRPSMCERAKKYLQGRVWLRIAGYWSTGAACQ